VLTLTISIPLCAQGPSPLSADAEQALDLGLSAVQAKHWEEAIQHFDDARRASPGAPEPLLDLGLAEAQLPGRELRAIAWFEAYLVIAPKSEDTSKVRSLIDQLMQKAVANSAQVVDAMKRAAALFPTDSLDYSKALETLYPDQIVLGDEDGAMESAQAAISAGFTYYEVALTFARYARGKAAIEIMDRYFAEHPGEADPRSRPDYYSQVYGPAMDALLARGETAEALEITQGLYSRELIFANDECDALIRIARKGFEARRPREALETLNLAEQVFRQNDQVREIDGGAGLLIGQIRLEQDDPAGAEAILPVLFNIFPGRSYTGWQDELRLDIAIYRASAKGDPDALRALEDRLQQVKDKRGTPRAAAAAPGFTSGGPVSEQSAERDAPWPFADAPGAISPRWANSSQQAVDAWVQLISDKLSDPLFTDFDNQVKDLSQLPAHAYDKSGAVFSALSGKAAILLNGLAAVRDMQLTIRPPQ